MPLPQWSPCGTYVYPRFLSSGILCRVVHQRGTMPEIHAQSSAPSDRQAPPQFQPEKIREHLHHLDRRQWWLWSTTVAVILLLTLAVASFAFPAMLSRDESSYSFYLNQAVRALVGLVLVFSVYLIYQQHQLTRIRHEVAEQMQSLAKVESLASEVYKLAALDQLTGLYNRRSGEQRLAQEISRAQRHGRPLTVLLMDLDGLKQINDRFGHAAGDTVLKGFADRLQRAIRGSDLACAWAVTNSWPCFRNAALKRFGTSWAVWKVWSSNSIMKSCACCIPAAGPTPPRAKRLRS